MICDGVFIASSLFSGFAVLAGCCCPAIASPWLEVGTMAAVYRFRFDRAQLLVISRFIRPAFPNSSSYP
jgi:hypothetical protein